jgi:hypothetical protein
MHECARVTFITGQASLVRHYGKLFARGFKRSEAGKSRWKWLASAPLRLHRQIGGKRERSHVLGSDVGKAMAAMRGKLLVRDVRQGSRISIQRNRCRAGTRKCEPTTGAVDQGYEKAHCQQQNERKPPQTAKAVCAGRAKMFRLVIHIRPVNASRQAFSSPYQTT